MELREKLACLTPDLEQAYRRLKDCPEILEIILYGTCNRMELLCVAEEPEPAEAQLRAFLSGAQEVSPEALAASIYVHLGPEAVRHLFRVAASLDSMVLGEPQILGQVKEAYRLATEYQATGPILNRLLHKTFSVAKRVRTETGIGDHAVSVSYAAVEPGPEDLRRAHRHDGAPGGRRRDGRTRPGAPPGPRSGGHRRGQPHPGAGPAPGGAPPGRSRLPGGTGGPLLRADILISSTGSETYLLRRDQVKAAMRRRKQRPLFLIDIAVPRDLDPAINDLDNVYLYNIDDLQEVVEQGRQARQQEAARAERLVAAETVKFQLASDPGGLPHHHRPEGKGRGHLRGGVEKDPGPVGAPYRRAATFPGGAA